MMMQYNSFNSFKRKIKSMDILYNKIKLDDIMKSVSLNKVILQNKKKMYKKRTCMETLVSQLRRVI